MSNKLFLLSLVAAIQVVRVHAWNVSISPDRLQVGSDLSTVTFTCTADSALAGCQFSWLVGFIKAAGPLLDLSRGPQSVADPAHLDDELRNYSYTGRGLGAGDCGLSMQVESYKYWMVACRVRAVTGGWRYAWAQLFATDETPLPLNVKTTREVVVLPGGEAHFMFKAEEPLKKCQFERPGSSGWPVFLGFSQGASSPDSTARYRYLGAGLESGECGPTLTNISQVDNGPIRGFMAAPGRVDEPRFMTLIVAHPPPAPTISLDYTGTNLTATCRVGDSRPVANISWVLGDKVIRQGKSDDSQASPYDTWRWPWIEGSNLQTLTLQLKPEDQGQVLKCVVSHLAWVQPHEAKAIILITGTTNATTSGTTTSATLATTPGTTTSAAPEPNCLATNILDLYLQLSQHGNTSCPKDEVREYRVREAKAAARTAEMEEEVARMKLEAEKITVEASKVALEAAKSSARAEEARARAEEARARAEEARAQNAEEEFKSERERRAKHQKTAQSPQSEQG